MMLLIPLVVAHTASVELSSSTGAQAMTDVRLGQLLSDQLQVPTSVTSVADAKEVFAMTGTTMLAKPKAVLLAVLDGHDVNGPQLQTECQPRQECIGRTCYQTSAACVAHALVSQTDDASTLAERQAERGHAVKAIASDPHTASAAGYGHVALVGKDNIQKTAIYELTAGTSPTQESTDLTNIASHVGQIQSLVEGDFAVHQNSVTMTMNGKKVTLDTDNQCVRLLLGETLAIHQMQAGTGESQFYLLAPRGVACMKADFGERSTEAHVAAALLEKAVSTTSQRLGAWSATVRMPTAQGPAKDLDDDILAPSLVQSKRRLTAVSNKELGVETNRVADYHIFTWSVVTIFLALYAAVYAITSMTNERDPLLYAKFRPEVDPSARR